MRRFLVLAALIGAVMVLLPADAEARRGGVHGRAGGVHRAAVVRPGGAGYRTVAVGRAGYYRGAYYGRGYRGGYYGRGYYRPGVAAGIAAGTPAAGAAAAAAPYYYGYGYDYPASYGYGYGYPASNACLRQQQVWTGYNYQWQWVRVC